MTGIDSLQSAIFQSQRDKLQSMHSGTSRETMSAARETAGAPGGRTIDEKLMGTCEDFEAIFIKQLLDVMRKTVNRSGLINRGMGEDIFEDMLYDEYAKKMVKTANLGISRLLYNQLSSYSANSDEQAD